MNHENILQMIDYITAKENLREVEVIHLKRYFLGLYTDLVQRQIADITNCERSTVAYSVRRITTKKYDLVRLRVGNALRNILLDNRGYVWLVKPEAI